MKHVTMKQKVQERYQEALQGFYVFSQLLANDTIDFYRERKEFNRIQVLLMADLLGIKPNYDWYPQNEQEAQITKELYDKYYKWYH